jgi:hypothetical protein
MMRRMFVICMTTIALALLAGVTPVFAVEGSSQWWSVGAEVTPTNLPPEHEGEPSREGQGSIVVVASDLGSNAINGGGGHQVVVADRLPAGVVATSIVGGSVHRVPVNCVLATLRCTFEGVLYPYERMSVTIRVKVEEPAGTITTLPNEVSVEGGGATHPASRVQQLHINGAPTPFGVQDQGYELTPYSQDGSPATQAASHPFQLTNNLVFNQTGDVSKRQPAALPRNLSFQLPLGLVGDPQATAQCPTADFVAHAAVSEVDQCPPDTVVGVANVTIDEPEVVHVISLTVPVFNLVPSKGEPARFGIEALGLVPVIIDTAVDPDNAYDITASVRNVSQVVGLLSAQVTLWGVPGDPRHNQARGWECVENGYHYELSEVKTPCPTTTNLPQTPLLTLPTSCPTNPTNEPFSSQATLEAWNESGQTQDGYIWSGPLGEPLGMNGCEVVPFAPAIETTPQQAPDQPTHAGGVPSGLDVDVRVPQGPTTEPNPDGVGEADVRDTTVLLPKGVTVNPSAANGLEACPEMSPVAAVEPEGVGFEGFQKVLGGEREPVGEVQQFSEGFRFVKEPGEHGRGPSCPDGSKVGIVHIKTPLLPKELEGGLYLAEPAPNGEAGKNPFDSLIAFYLVAQDEEAGILVKLAGEGKLDPVTGQVSTTFRDTPQLPFEDLKVELFGGQRASLATPGFCGRYQTEAVFTPWSVPFGGPSTNVLSGGEEFQITENCSGGSTLGFAPGFSAQSSNAQAGGFSSFSLGLDRGDGQQQLSGLSVHLPAGISALLSSVSPCPEPPVGQPWHCGAGSLIGHSQANSGVGSEPVTLPGNVYLTGGYDGAPFGVLDETHAQAGPFDLGEVYVRSRINVDPNTAAVTITTDPGPHHDNLPTILKGIPVDVKQLSVTVDKPNFELNPTSCNPTSITGTLDGGEGAQAGVSSSFQMGGCQSLPFTPTFTASAVGAGSKANGTTFAVTVTSPGVNSNGDSEAGIAKVDLQLPKQLSSRLATLQKACLAATFEVNPASCPEGSNIGHATIHTPILANPLTGPAYLVSHGSAGFPDVAFVLQGEGITLVLDGHTDIKGGITYSRFESTPDAPFTTFETVLPAGPHGVLTPNVAESKHFDLCGEKLTMPTTFVAQNGKTLQQTTPITIQGCGAVKASKARKLTRAQLLTRALKACRHKYKHNKHKRQTCERQAHKKYGPKKKTKPAHKTAKKVNHTHA